MAAARGWSSRPSRRELLTFAVAAKAGATDAEQLTFTAGIERGLGAIYDTVIAAGRLDPSVTAMLGRFARHHVEHASAIEHIAALPPVAPSAALTGRYAPLMEAARTTRVLALARQLEDALAATHLRTLGTLTGAADALVIARALPVECDHSVALGTRLHQPVTELATSDGTETTDGALSAQHLG